MLAGRAGEITEPPGELVPGLELAQPELAGQLTHGQQRGDGRVPVRDHLAGELAQLLLLNLPVLELAQAVLQALQVLDRALVRLRLEQ